MLVAGDIDAVDVFYGVSGSLALIDILLPFADAQPTVAIHRDAEAVALAVLPHSVINLSTWRTHNAVPVWHPLLIGFAVILCLVDGDGGIHGVFVLIQQKCLLLAVLFCCVVFVQRADAVGHPVVLSLNDILATDVVGLQDMTGNALHNIGRIII